MDIGRLWNEEKMANKPQFQNTAIVKEGLWKRLNLLFLYLPLAFVAITNAH
jgi:hypothetical protein